MRRGEARATRRSGLTGQTAGRPARGSRMIPDRKPEAAAFGRPGRTDTVIRRRDASVDETAPGVVRDQLLADEFRIP